MQRIIEQAQMSSTYREKLISVIHSIKQDRMAVVMESTKAME